MKKYKLMDINRGALEISENRVDKDKYKIDGVEIYSRLFGEKLRELLKDKDWDYIHVKITAEKRYEKQGGDKNE